MKVRSTRLLVVVGFLYSFSFPIASMATSLYHPSTGDRDTVHWDHLKSTKARAEVVAELEAARNDGSLRIMQSESGFDSFTSNPSPSNGTKTREQVRQEFLNMTVTEKAEAAKLYGGNR